MDGKQAKARPDQRREYVRGNTRGRETPDARVENDEK